jgi:hypothetical protein
MPSLQQQLDVLYRVGIRLNPGVLADALLSELTLQDYEADPYVALMCIMGEDERLSRDVWHFDSECIEGDGSYMAIAHRLRDLSDGLLPLEDIADFVPNNGLMTGSAMLAFRLHGQVHKWRLKIEDAWVDSSLFRRFARLLAAQNTSKHFIYYGLGQDGLIAFASPEQLETLNRETGLDFTWLT